MSDAANFHQTLAMSKATADAAAYQRGEFQRNFGVGFGEHGRLLIEKHSGELVLALTAPEAERLLEFLTAHAEQIRQHASAFRAALAEADAQEWTTLEHAIAAQQQPQAQHAVDPKTIGE
jgi:hypothetical protein